MPAQWARSRPPSGPPGRGARQCCQTRGRLRTSGTGGGGGGLGARPPSLAAVGDATVMTRRHPRALYAQPPLHPVPRRSSRLAWSVTPACCEPRAFQCGCCWRLLVGGGTLEGKVGHQEVFVLQAAAGFSGAASTAPQARLFTFIWHAEGKKSCKKTFQISCADGSAQRIYVGGRARMDAVGTARASETWAETARPAETWAETVRAVGAVTAMGDGEGDGDGGGDGGVGAMAYQVTACKRGLRTTREGGGGGNPSRVRIPGIYPACGRDVEHTSRY